MGIHDVSASNSPKNGSPTNKRCRIKIAENEDDATDERREVVITDVVEKSTSDSFFGGRVRTGVPSSSLTEAHTALSTSFVNHFKKEEHFLPTKEKNRRSRCIYIL